jgi:hypothetical protein
MRRLPKVGLAFAIAGTMLMVMTVLVHSDNVVFHEAFSGGEGEYSLGTVHLEGREYEIWLNEECFADFFFMISLVDVDVYDPSGYRMEMDYPEEDNDRTIEGVECQMYSTISVTFNGMHEVTVDTRGQGMDDVDEGDLFILTPRPALYGQLIWSGFFVMLIGIALLATEGLRKLVEMPIHQRPPPFVPSVQYQDSYDFYHPEDYWPVPGYDPYSGEIQPPPATQPYQTPPQQEVRQPRERQVR